MNDAPDRLIVHCAICRGDVGAIASKNEHAWYYVGPVDAVVCALCFELKPHEVAALCDVKEPTA